jgi:N-acetylmuramoyl-L-alanine amidase
MGVRRRDLLRGGIVGALVAGIALRFGTAEARRRHPPHRRIKRRRVTPLPLVVIDPGHGGKDPGCIGIDGVMEKHVVLAVGLELRRRLLASRRCRVMMTRSTDVFVPLQERVAFARRHRAVAFLSLHVNASHNHAACGACVYRFGLHASDAAAAAEARWENSADNIVRSSIAGRAQVVVHILASLMRQETMVHSAALQRDVVQHLGQHTSLTPDATRHARFVVLTAPDIASVLVEMGFLTNQRDAALLRSRSYHIVLARAMSYAVERYVAKLPRPRRSAG